MVLPPSSVSSNPTLDGESRTIRPEVLIRAPRRVACSAPRSTSSLPDTPAGKPKKFSIRDVVPACPPGPTASITSVSRPSEAPYTAAASPAGPAPTTTTSYTWPSTGRKARPRWAASSLTVGLRSTAFGVTTTGTSLRRTPMLAMSTSMSPTSGPSRSIHV